MNKYSAIAAEYRENVKNGLSDPVGEIARRHGVKPSTARGWVYRTRKLGFLGHARGRTSGEL
jgi:transposase-like protein